MLCVYCLWRMYKMGTVHSHIVCSILPSVLNDIRIQLTYWENANYPRCGLVLSALVLMKNNLIEKKIHKICEGEMCVWLRSTSILHIFHTVIWLPAVYCTTRVGIFWGATGMKGSFDTNVFRGTHVWRLKWAYIYCSALQFYGFTLSPCHLLIVYMNRPSVW